MAVVVSAYDLIVRADSLGNELRAFIARAPNRTFCSDGRIARLSFMAAADREHCVSTARLPPGSFARVDKRNGATDVDWLEVGRHGGVDATWLRGAPRDPLVVPVAWTPSEHEFLTTADVKQHLTYLGIEGNVESYLDKRTGKKMYIGRTQPVVPPPQAERLEALRHEANALVQPLVFKKSLGFFERRRLKKGVAMLNQVIAAIPDHWSSRWILGMSLRALADHQGAFDQLRQAYKLQPGQRDVGREYAGQCFILGLSEEGVEISRELHARFPDDVAWRSAEVDRLSRL